MSGSTGGSGEFDLTGADITKIRDGLAGILERGSVAVFVAALGETSPAGLPLALVSCSVMVEKADQFADHAVKAAGDFLAQHGYSREPGAELPVSLYLATLDRLEDGMKALGSESTLHSFDDLNEPEVRARLLSVCLDTEEEMLLRFIALPQALNDPYFTIGAASVINQHRTSFSKRLVEAAVELLEALGQNTEEGARVTEIPSPSTTAQQAAVEIERWLAASIEELNGPAYRLELLELLEATDRAVLLAGIAKVYMADPMSALAIATVVNQFSTRFPEKLVSAAQKLLERFGQDTEPGADMVVNVEFASYFTAAVTARADAGLSRALDEFGVFGGQSNLGFSPN